jgi:hypothetical protein
MKAPEVSWPMIFAAMPPATYTPPVARTVSARFPAALPYAVAKSSSVLIESGSVPASP